VSRELDRALRRANFRWQYDLPERSPKSTNGAGTLGAVIPSFGRRAFVMKHVAGPAACVCIEMFQVDAAIACHDDPPLLRQASPGHFDLRLIPLKRRAADLNHIGGLPVQIRRQVRKGAGISKQ